jgi:glycosyltransferase involved in cell wall biosynthesis
MAGDATAMSATQGAGRASDPPAYALYGLFDMQCGMRVAAENTAEVLRGRCRPIVLRSIQADGSLLDRGDTAAVPVINLFHANPDWVGRMLAAGGDSGLALRDRLNVCVPFWELPVMPRDWAALLGSMDIVLAPSTFVREALAEIESRVLVVDHPQAAFLPAGIAADRQRFGIPRDAIAFAMSFAADSSVDRKDPFAAIRAFKLAFPDDPQVRLVVRAHATLEVNAHMMPADLRSFADDPRILLVGGELSYRDVLSLYMSCDAYVSLHRSEGLGLGPMEAMTLGKPVIATGWSGNMDFMDSQNSLPVPYRLVDVDVAEGSPYGSERFERPVHWAEPDVERAAEMMRLVRDEEGLRVRIGERAAADMAARRERVMRGGFIDAIEDARKALLEDPEHARKSLELEMITRAAGADRGGLLGDVRSALGGLGRKLTRRSRSGEPRV